MQTFAGAEEEDRKRKNEYVRTVQRLFSEAEELLESVLDDAPTPAADQIWKRKGVYLDVGHGKKPGIYDPGAVHSGSDITEHALNLVTAAACEAALNAPVQDFPMLDSVPSATGTLAVFSQQTLFWPIVRRDIKPHIFEMRRQPS